jgi:replicative superfamily II helicase
MDAQKFEFIQLIDRALEISQQMRVENQSEHLDNVIDTLQSIKSQTVAGQLEPSHGTSTLGLARAVADWIDSLDSPLLEAVGAIEQYYQKHCDR